MKVLYLVPEGGPGRLSAMSFIDEEIVALTRRGIDAQVLAPDIRRDETVQGIRKRAVHQLVGRAGAITSALRWLPYLPLRATARHVSYAAYVLRAEAAAAELVRAEGFDIIHSHFGAFGGIGGRLAARRSRVPLVASFRGMDLVCDPEFRYGLRQNDLFDAHVRRLLREADRTLYVSEFMRTTGIGLGAPPDRTQTVLKGVDLDAFQPAASGDAARRKLSLDGVVVLTVASMLPKKGIDIALRAIAALPGDVRVQYVVCGDGREHERLARLTRELGIEDRVRFAGRVPRDVVADYFAAADIFVMTSFNEGSGNVYLEAQASGKPAIGSDSGGAPEYIRDGETGFTVPYGNVELLAQRIQQLIDHPERRAQMGRAARQWMEQGFAYERMENDILRAYDLAMQSSGRLTPPSPPSDIP